MGKPQIPILKEKVIPTPKINLSKSGVKKMNYPQNYVDISPPDSPYGRDFLEPSLNILGTLSNKEDPIINDQVLYPPLKSCTKVPFHIRINTHFHLQIYPEMH